MIELERACLLNTHSVPAPIKHRENMRPALGTLLTPEIELDNHNFGLTKRTTGFSLPIKPHPRPSISGLPSRSSARAAVWGVLSFASQLLSWGLRISSHRRGKPSAGRGLPGQPPLPFPLCSPQSCGSPLSDFLSLPVLLCFWLSLIFFSLSLTLFFHHHLSV